MSRAVLIFGAGLNQLTLIEAAKQLGLVAVVIDPAENPPGKDKADHFYQVRAEDYFATKEIAIKHEVVGIATSQMERPLKLMSLLARDLGYIFHTPEVVARSTNKYLMKKAFQAGRVPCAQGELICGYRKLEKSEFASYHLPVVIKPLCGFSSRGVYIIDSFQSYLKEIESTLSFSQDGSYLIEEFIDGQEYSVESITYRGVTSIIQYTEKLVSSFPYTVELGHIQPAGLSDHQRKEISELVVQAINSLGIDNSAAHTELKWTKKGPLILEIGPRSGGDFIGSYLTLASTGINLDQAVLQVALGKNPELTPKKNAAAAILYLTLPEGSLVQSIEQVNHPLPNGFCHHIDIKVGDTIPSLTDSSKRPGWVIVTGRDREEAKSAAESAIRLLKQSISCMDDDILE